MLIFVSSKKEKRSSQYTTCSGFLKVPREERERKTIWNGLELLFAPPNCTHLKNVGGTGKMHFEK